jgi:hypothetical protein
LAPGNRREALSQATPTTVGDFLDEVLSGVKTVTFLFFAGDTVVLTICPGDSVGWVPRAGALLSVEEATVTRSIATA